MNEDELATYIGRRVLDDADKLRLFAPECCSRFTLTMAGYVYDVVVIPKGTTDLPKDRDSQ